MILNIRGDKHSQVTDNNIEWKKQKGQWTFEHSLEKPAAHWIKNAYVLGAEENAVLWKKCHFVQNSVEISFVLFNNACIAIKSEISL